MARRTTIVECAEALTKSGGFVSYAAKMLGIAHSSLRERILRHPELQKVQKEVSDSYLDMAEHSLVKKVKDGDLGAICFFLKCKGKERGYVERTESENKNSNTNVNIETPASLLSSEQLERIVNASKFDD
jgi:hypothetical protein